MNNRPKRPATPPTTTGGRFGDVEERGIGNNLEIQLPTWPQKFTLEKEEKRAIFGFPLTSPGTIIASIKLKRAEAGIALIDPAGKTIKREKVVAGRPVKITYQVNGAAAKRGILWKIVITRKTGTEKRTLSGEISIETPPADAGKVKEYWMQTLKKNPMPSPEVAAAKHLLTLQKSLESSNRSRKAQTESLLSQIKAKIRKAQTAESARVIKAQQKQAKSIAASLRRPSRGAWSFEGAALSDTTIEQQPPLWQLGDGLGGGGGGTELSLVNVVPNIGYQGDEVVITGTGLSADPSMLRVFFYIAPASEYPPDGVIGGAKVITRKDTGIASEITVKVPNPPVAYSGPGLLNVFCGNIYIYDEGVRAFTNRVSFTYIPKPVPVVTRVTDAVTGSTDLSDNTLIRIEGKNFGDQSQQGTYWIGPNGEYIKQNTTVGLQLVHENSGASLTIQYLSDTLILAQMYGFGGNMEQVQAARLIVCRQFRDSLLESNSVFLSVLPRIGYISAISPQPMIPGQPITLTGDNLLNGFLSLHFLLGAKDVAVDRSQINVVTDKFAVLVVPVMGAFAETTPGSVYLQSRSYQADNPTTINGDPFPCMYAPKIVSNFLPVKKDALPDPNDFQFSTKGDGGQLVFNDQNISGSHFAGFFWGFKDNDLMFLKTYLKNNWILEDIIFTKATSTGDVNIWKSHKGTDILYTQLHWWVDGTGGVVYWISWKVKGPDGMPYF